MARTIPISEIYLTGDCDFNYNGILTNQDYVATGFSLTELKVVTENNLLSDIMYAVPDFSKYELIENSY